MSPKMQLAFWPPSAPALFSTAVDSAKRIAGSHKAGGHKDALVSVVFAAAALEAFLNESAYLAERQARVVATEPQTVSAFAQVMEEAEESRVTIKSKFQIGNLVLTGKAYDKGGRTFPKFF